MVSKRERAKQRKAAAEAKSSTSNNAEVGSGTRLTSRQFLKALNRMPTTKIVGLVKQGDILTTTALAESKIKISYQKSGVLSAVLGLLQRCGESFDEVMSDVSFLGQEGEVAQLETPFTWINILVTASTAETSCSLKIVEGIGPLVDCMCDDMTRLCFKSNKHWRESIYPFAGLIQNLIHTSVSKVTYGSEIELGKKVIDALLKHNCLVRCIFQWGFWDSSNRPDITNELTAEVCESIVEFGANSAKLVIAMSRDKQQVKSIGSMSFINKDYDPNCTVSYVEGLMRLLKRQGQSFGKLQYPLLRTFILFADCVDKAVMKEIIDLGTNFTSDLDCADRLTRFSYPMLLQKTDTEKDLPCDTRTAFAIRAGLIEMCLNFIGRFGDHESFRIDDYDTLSLFDNVENTFETVYDISLHQKTAKAIRSKRRNIESELVILQEDDNIQNNPNCKILLDMVKSILDINGSYCCRCNKPLSRTEVMECNGCHRMTYCSRACQREDWLNGHKLACCKSYTPELSGQFQGRLWWPIATLEDERAAQKMEEVEKNISMVQLKLFLDNAEDILSQAMALNLPLYVCIVKFDLRQYPPTIEVYKYTEFYDTPVLRKGFEESQSTKNITCVYYSYVLNGELDKETGEKPFLYMQRFFPHKWLTEKEAID